MAYSGAHLRGLERAATGEYGDGLCETAHGDELDREMIVSCKEKWSPMERGDPVVVAASTFGLQFRQELCAHAQESHHLLSTYQSVSLQPINLGVSLGGTIIEPRNIPQSFNSMHAISIPTQGANNINMLCELYKLTSRYSKFVPDSKPQPSADLKHQTSVRFVRPILDGAPLLSMDMASCTLLGLGL